MKMQEIPLHERPREKAILNGVECLSNQELLQIILGFGGKTNSIINISQELINNFNGVQGLMNASIGELTKIKGISKAKGLLILSIIELSKRMNESKESNIKLDTSEDVYDYLHHKIENEPQENFFLLLLDAKGKLITSKKLFVGGLTYNIIHMRDIYREVVRHNACKFICVHNHPSGDPSPSKADYDTTLEITKSAKMMGINFVDHIIIGKSRYFSFRGAGLI